MVNINRIIFWEPCVSPHKSALLEALVRYRPEVEIICCAQEEVSSDRKSQGWESGNSDIYLTHIAPTENEIVNLTTSQVNSTVHIFSGIRHIPIIKSALNKVVNNKSIYYILSEPRSFEGVAGYLRLFQSWFSEHDFRSTTAGVLAIGANGKPWFSKAGYSKNKIFPFAYYLEASDADSCLEQENNKPCKIVYIGRLTKIKGVNYLIDAMNVLGDRFQLNVIGVGEQRAELERSAMSNTFFSGAIPNKEISNILASSDILVLPSISDDDGWGAVVSEALLQGCLVIVTDKAGASSVVINKQIGVVVKSKCTECLVNSILGITGSNLLSLDSKHYRANFAKNNLTGQAGAKYLWSIIQYTLNNQPMSTQFLNAENVKNISI